MRDKTGTNSTQLRSTLCSSVDDTPQLTRLWMLLVLIGVLAGTSTAPPARAQDPWDDPRPITYQGHSYASDVSAPPTADKPQSKLWYHDGSWWALMLSPATDAVHVFELLEDHTWRDTGTLVDARRVSTGDALWEDGRLYVGSRTPSEPALLNRFSYDQSTRRYIADSGFPVQITPVGSESLTIARDSTGVLWATYTYRSRVYVTHTTGNDREWADAFEPPVDDTLLKSDDISAIIAFEGQIGLMWSNQLSDHMRFVTRRDGDPPDVWGPLETALDGTRMADDHINLKSMIADEQGRIFAATKTEQGEGGEGPESPLIMLLVRARDGSWSHHVHSTYGDRMTRPVISLDESNRLLYFFATGPTSGGTVFYKVTPIDDISFGPGRGEPFVTWPDVRINNVSTSKHPVNATTNLVALASDRFNNRYYHTELEILEPDHEPPTTPTGLTATAVTATRIDLAWTPSTDNVAIRGYRVYRDGEQVAETSEPAFVDRPVASGTTYTYTVEAFDPSWNLSERSAPATATTPPRSGDEIHLTGRSFAGNETASTLTIPVPEGAGPGDVLIASVDVNRRPKIADPEGWTRVAYDEYGDEMRKATYYRVVDGSEPASYTWEFSKTRAAAGSILSYGGVDPNDPVAAVGSRMNPVATQATAPSVTTAVGDTRLVAFFGHNTSTTLATPAGMDALGGADGLGKYPITGHAADAPHPSPGPTGDKVAPAGAPAPSVGHLVALRPGDITPPTVPTHLSATATSPTRVNLEWQPSTDNIEVAGYTVYRDGVAVRDTTATFFPDRPVSPATTYTYTVEAFDPSGNRSGPSTPVTVSTPELGDEDTLIMFRGATSAVTEDGLSVTVPVPDTADEGDFLLATMDIAARASVTPPPGWTLLRNELNGDLMRKATYYRVAESSEPSTYTWTLGNNRAAVGTIAAYRGVNAEDPVDAFASHMQPSSAQVIAPSVTTDAVGGRVIALFGAAGAVDLLPPDELTTYSETTSLLNRHASTVLVGDASVPQAGVTGPFVAVADEPVASVAHTVALRPGDVTPPTVPEQLTATAVTATRVDVTWEASTDNVGVSGYRLYRNGDQVAETTATAYVDRPVQAGTTHVYTVEAFDEAGNVSPQAPPVTTSTPPVAAGHIHLTGRSFAGNDTADTLTIPVPAGTSAGDVLVASVDVNRAPRITPPAGWTQIAFDDHGSDLAKATYYRVAGSAEPASYTWSFSKNRAAAGGILAYGGVDAGDPIAAVATRRNPSSTTVTAPSVTTSVGNARVVVFYGHNIDTTLQSPSDLAMLGDLVGAGKYPLTTHAADGTQPGPGSTGQKVATAAAPAVSVGHTVALKPGP